MFRSLTLTITVDGVSRGYSFYYRSTSFDERNIARFSTDTLGATVSFGYPISEISRFNFTLGAEDTEIKEGIFPAQEISRFLAEEGNEFKLITLSAAYQMSALNRGLLPNCRAIPDACRLKRQFQVASSSFIELITQGKYSFH